jgi:hypothetical protein
MRRSLLLVAVIFVALGLVWIGQGSGLIAGSGMSGSRFWEAAGILLVVVGLVIAAREWVRRPTPPR